MLVHIGLENHMEGRSLAWALGYPGCFTYGADGSEAIIAMGQAIPNYIGWIEAHTSSPWFNPPDIDIRLDEVWEDYYLDAAYQKTPQDGRFVQAWFLHDWKPLSQEDIEHGQQLLQWGRADLLTAASGFPEGMLDASFPGEEKTPRGILAHVATANWWLLDRLGLAETPRSGLPKDVDERLRTQHDRLLDVLPELVDIERVVGRDGELWSPRKLLRRAVWHELDHAGHLRRLAAEARQASPK